MSPGSPIPALFDIVEAIERVRVAVGDTTLESFEADWQKRWIVERGIEIISEASRRLPDGVRQRHPEIPWKKVAGIGNVLRHEYHHVAPAVLWNVIRDLGPLERICKEELARK